MKIAAVICEYNPFHLGHLRQLALARQVTGCDAVVGLMSGSFVQRGEAAVYPKAARARAALAGGVDLVLELPAVLTLHSAERYARNAVRTLDALGCVNQLFFGAETPDTEKLQALAQMLAEEKPPFGERLRDGLNQGLAFAAARARAAEAVLGPEAAELLRQPNNILAVEYCKALYRRHSKIRPLALPREGPAHDGAEPQDGMASASALRAMLCRGEAIDPYLPEGSREAFAGLRPFSQAALEPALLANLCLMPPERLRETADVGEGLEHALKRAALTAPNLEALLLAVKSKRYAYSRLRRIALNAYLDVTRQDTERLPSYIRVLDFNPRGREALNLVRGKTDLPLAKNAGQIKGRAEALELWRRELDLDRVYDVFAPQNAD